MPALPRPRLRQLRRGEANDVTAWEIASLAPWWTMRDTCGSRTVTFTMQSTKSNLVDAIRLGNGSSVAAQTAEALPRHVVERQRSGTAAEQHQQHSSLWVSKRDDLKVRRG